MIDFSLEKDFISYKKGDQIFTEGDDGEMALMDSTERSATAIAIKPSTVAVISRERFLEMVKDNPDFALEVMSTLAQRLRVELKLHSI